MKSVTTCVIPARMSRNSKRINAIPCDIMQRLDWRLTAHIMESNLSIVEMIWEIFSLFNIWAFLEFSFLAMKCWSFAFHRIVCAFICSAFSGG